MSKFKVLVLDGQGSELQCGSPKAAIKQAKKMLGCRKDDIQIINAWNLGEACYFFDASKADSEYWLTALKLTGSPGFVGQPAA